MEIEKKYLVKELPKNMQHFQKKKIEQGYLCRNPIIRIRKSNEDFILTYKSKFGITEEMEQHAKVCNEVELPLTEEGYFHLKNKVDGNMVYKTRYIIPLENNLRAELDIFERQLDGLVFLEVEFPNEKAVEEFKPPEWFGDDVSRRVEYTNSYLSTIEKLNKNERSN